mgnify:CR=1 FL=1
MAQDKKEKAEEKEVSKEEVLEEILEETPEAEVVGEETSDIQNIGGALYRVVVDDDGTHYVPL